MSHPSFPRPRALPAALFAILLSPLPGLAQSASDSSSAAAEDAAVDLKAVHVNAYRTATHASGATKTDTPVLETPQSVSVITRDELDARGVKNLNEAVRYEAGVLGEAEGIDNRVDTIYIRGFNVGGWSNYSTLDGMRLPRGGQWTTVQIDSWDLERVEVLKGPSAVLYGQLAPGGLINQISKTPDPDQAQQLRVGVDGYGAYQSAFDLGGKGKDDRLLYRLVGLYSDGPTQIKHSDRKHWFLAPSATWRFSDDTRLTLLGIYQKDDGGSTFQFLPYQGTVVPTKYGYIKNSTFLGEPNWNVYDRQTWTAGWLFEHDFNEHWKLSQSARASHVDTLFRTVVAGTTTLTDGRLLGRRAVQGVGAANGKTADTRLEGKFATGALRHDVLIGVDWQETDWYHNRDYASVSTSAIAIDVFDPVYTYYDFASVLTPQLHYRGHNQQTGGYLQDQLSLGNWRFTLGARYDDAKVRAYESVSYKKHFDTDDSALTKRFGALYLFDSGLAPYLSYSESFEPTSSTSSTRNGDTLKATEGKQWEAGLKYQPTRVDGMVTLSAYDLRQSNVVSDDPSNTGSEAYVVQTGQVRVRGLELEGRVTPLPGFSVIGAVSRMQSDILKDTENAGNRMIYVPDWMGSLWLDYTFQEGALAGLSIAAGTRYVGETYGDVANLYLIPSHTLYDAALRYDAGRFGATGVKLALNASNLANKRYVSTCNSATSCYYGSGRAVTATATFSW
ncbi:MAG: TonB-dependent siderophore receptor [Pseudoxanthomonas sp.]